MMTDNEIKVVSEKIESLHDKILKSKFAETVTESEMLSLIFAVRGLNDQKAEIERLEEILGGTSKVLAETCAGVKAEAVKEFAEKVKTLNRQNLFLWNEQIDNLVKEMVGEG